MNKSFLQKMKALLLSQKQELLKQTGQEVTVDTEGDETDEIQGNMLMEMANQLGTRNTAKLNQIQVALKRIEEKTYGLCLDCEETIPEKRLMANPYAQLCVSCAEDREAKEKRKGF
jgi:DnaK suppressor protein